MTRDRRRKAEYVSDDSPDAIGAGTRLGPYRISDMLGEGGMGRVFRAVDTRLDRAVAIKISAERFSARFERESRAISALNHPHICTLFDVGSVPSGAGYMVTELVEGETLRARLQRRLPSETARSIAHQVLEALRAAHAAGIIHRDLKPANIMLRPDGYVKVLDFGLAKRIPAAEGSETVTLAAEVSVPGQIVGTIAYMSPEQIRGREADARSDLFAFGIVFYEMLTGRHPWPREYAVDTMQAILHEEPATLDASAEGAAEMGPVLFKLLAKLPADRHQSAAEVLAALDSPSSSQNIQRAAAQPRKLIRLIALPFRLLRRDEATDFLAVSLPDAITTSLAAIDSLLVRSSLTASRFDPASADVKQIAEQAQVDAILTGSVLSDGERLRVTTQLVEAPGGAVLWTNAAQVSISDIFQLQDDLVQRILQALTVSLTAPELRALHHDVPSSAAAYEFYLRGNQLVVSANIANMRLARDLYERAVEMDGRYAPAWAHLGRVYRFLAKYGVEKKENYFRAEEAFRRAFELNPDLPIAHHFYTALETDLGRNLEAMGRLLERMRSHQNDVVLLSGLVYVLRYCDLLDASVAAHRRARQIDPNAETSVPFTYMLLGEYDKALASSPPSDRWVRIPALLALGRNEEAAALAHSVENPDPWTAFYGVMVKGDKPKSLSALLRAQELYPVHVSDPEAGFFNAGLLGRLDQAERALEFAAQAVDRGYACHYALLHDPDLASVRALPGFQGVADRAATLSAKARSVFSGHGGEWLLEDAPVTAWNTSPASPAG